MSETFSSSDDQELKLSVAEPAVDQLEQAQSERQGIMDGQYTSVDQKIYSTGAKHIYGVDADGKRHHLSHDQVLEHYGHAGDYGKNQVVSEQTEQPATTAAGRHARRESSETPLFDELMGQAGEAVDDLSPEPLGTPIFDSIKGQPSGKHRRADSVEATGRHSSGVNADETADAEYAGRHRKAETPKDGEDDFDIGEITAEELIRLLTQQGLIPNGSEQAESAPQSAEIPGPLADTTLAGRIARVRIKYEKAKGVVSNLYPGAGAKFTMLQEFYSDKERGKRRLGLTGLAIGGMALIASVALARHGGEIARPSGGSHLNEALGAGKGLGNAAGHANEALVGSHMVLGHGDTIWGDVYKMLHDGGYDASTEKVKEFTGVVLKANHLTWQQAHNLPVGFSFDIPAHALDDIAKVANS